MQSPGTISSVQSVAVIFFIMGFAAGWLFSRVRVKGAINVSVLPPGATSGLGSSLITSKTIRTRALNLKCQCGETWQFRETSGHADAGSLPFPTGDSFTCPKCGKSIDLSQERKLEAEAMAKLPGLN
jgi:hypothetical protein